MLERCLRCRERLKLWARIPSSQFCQPLQLVIHLHGNFLSKAVPLQGSWKFHPALRTCLDLGRTFRADDVGVWAHEDWGLGCFQADGTSEVFFLLFDGLLEKLD